MHSDYYTLDNGKQAIFYIFEYSLGFSYGNAFKYLVRHSRKPGNSSESDLNKALTYILSSDNELSTPRRIVKSVYNSFRFNDKIQFASRNLADILCAIIKFKDSKVIARLIIKYMDTNNIRVNDEFAKYR